MATQTFKVVVYGGDLPGVFAAAKAAAELASGKVALIVPYPKTRYKNESGTWVEDYLLGGIMTAGGLNYWDDKTYKGSLVQQGSYYFYRNSLGSGFNRIALSDKCKTSMANGNVTIFYGQDIFSCAAGGAPYKITSVTISPIGRDSQDRVVFTNTATKTTLNATVFIDASVDGRIARKVNSACTVGRYSWPASYLPADEQAATDFVGRQQAATIMIKMRNIEPTVNRAIENGKTAALWAPHDPYYDKNGPVVAFNDLYKDSERIMVKPPNAARDGVGKTGAGAYCEDWWVNGLLIFDVDGRAHYRDEASSTDFKVTRKYNYMTTDAAWIKAKNFVKNHKSELESAFQAFNGFANATIVTDDYGDPVVGDQLYIRETVHMSISSKERAHGTYNSNYQVGANEALDAGTSPTSGGDKGNYATRIGLAFYGCDIHPYQPSDYVKKGSNPEEYICAQESYTQMWKAAKDPKNPLYMPYDALRTGYVANLLIPGYAANVCSYSWGEVRVFSNLSVLGDAAGIAAGYCCNNNIQPNVVQSNSTTMAAIQNKIKAIGGKIDK